MHMHQWVMKAVRLRSQWGSRALRTLRTRDVGQAGPSGHREIELLLATPGGLEGDVSILGHKTESLTRTMITDVTTLPLESNESGMFSRFGMNGAGGPSRLNSPRSNRIANAAGAHANARRAACVGNMGKEESVSSKRGEWPIRPVRACERKRLYTTGER